MLRLLKIILGVFCIIIGFVALVTPLTPGAWLLIVGLELLGLTSLLPAFIRIPWEKFKLKMSKKF